MARCLDHPEAPQIESKAMAESNMHECSRQRDVLRMCRTSSGSAWSRSKAGPLTFITRPNAVTGLGPLCTYPDPQQLGPLHRL